MSDVSSEPGAAPRQIRDRSAFLLIITATFGLQGLTLVTGIIIARALGVEGRGVVALIFALGVFASQLTFGSSLPIALAKNLAERRVAARDGLRTIARRRVALLLLPSLAAGGLFLFLQRADADTETYVLGGAAVLMTLQTLIFRILAGCLQGEGRLVRMAWVGMTPQLLFTIVLGGGWLAGWDWDVLSLFLAYFVSTFLGLVFAFASLIRPTGRREDQLDERALWSESRRSYVGSVHPLDGIGLDRVFVGGLLGTISLGLYAAATAVSNLCSLVGNAVTVIVLPRVAMHHADPAAQRAVIRRWVGLSAVLIVLMVAALQVIVAPAIRIAFGEEFVGAIEVARWLILADGLMAFRRVLISVLQGVGRGATASWIELVLLPVMILSIVAAAMQNSLPGIGISLAVVGLLSCLAHGWAVARRDRHSSSGQPVSPPATTRT